MYATVKFKHSYLFCYFKWINLQKFKYQSRDLNQNLLKKGIACCVIKDQYTSLNIKWVTQVYLQISHRWSEVFRIALSEGLFYFTLKRFGSRREW